jgi:hypothetical protein
VLQTIMCALFDPNMTIVLLLNESSGRTECGLLVYKADTSKRGVVAIRYDQVRTVACLFVDANEIGTKCGSWRIGSESTSSLPSFS